MFSSAVASRSFIQCFHLCDVAFKKLHVATILIWTWRILKLWMKSEVHINLSIPFWFIPCLLWIQYPVSFTSLSFNYTVCTFSVVIIGSLLKNFISSAITWQLCRLSYLCLLDLSFFVMRLFVHALTNLHLLSAKLTQMVHKQCWTSLGIWYLRVASYLRTFPHFFKLQVYLLYKKEGVLFSLTWIHIKYGLISY